MRRILFAMLAAAMAAASPLTTVRAGGTVESRRGVVRVKLQPEVARRVAKSPSLRSADGKVASGVASLDNALNLISGVSIRPMLPPNPKFAAQRAKFGLDQWYVVKFDERLAPEQVTQQLKQVAGVMRAETVKPMQLKEGTGGFRKAQPTAARAKGSYPFNDPRLPEQWHYQNFGDKGTMVAGADINLFDAWKQTTGSNKVLVAIIDGGVDYTHEDLAANMFVNELEKNGEPGVDDDGNGYVDDIYGYNFCTQTGEVYPHSHGTHVAGTVAAVNNNGIGVAGVAGGDGTPGSGVKMVSCQVFDSRQGSGDADFAEAIIYACERGATIAQCSWGWADAGYYEQAVLDAIDYFTESARSDNMTGGLMIFAAGNEGQAGEYYPAAYPKTLAVAAMTADLRPASYSCYGDWVDLIAPGGLLDYGEQEGILSTLPGNEYGFNEGTSMATPHVSGIAALVLSKYGSPTFVNSSLRTQLETSVNDFYGAPNNEKFRGEYGSGYIDAAKALQMGDGTAPEAVQDFQLQAAQDYISVSWVIPASSDNNVHSHIIYYSTTPFTADGDLTGVKSVVADTKFATSGDTFTQEISGLTPLTTYYVALRAVNRWGAASPLSEVKEIRTNEGPEMTLTAERLSLESTAAQPVGTATFGIGNVADGILKWQSAKATVSARPAGTSAQAAAAKPASKPMPGAVRQAFEGRIGAQPNASKATGKVTGEYEATDYPKTLKYYDAYYAVIGESDLSQPNSMAQFFWVDPEKYPDGFNLSSIVVDYTYGKNPKIQVYKGTGSIATATLLQDVKYDWFTSKSPIALNEQIHFAANETFWIVVHFEGGQESWSLPTALYSDEYSYVSTYSYMSNDLGKTWVPLKTALKGSIYEEDADKMTWGVYVRSDNPDLNDVITLTPASGTVLKGETQEVKATADGSKLVNGTYKFNIKLSTNQTENNEVKIPVTYTVEGNEAKIETPKVVDFGSLLVGQSKTLSVEVFNEGYGAFYGSKWAADIYGSNITSSSAHFAGPAQVQGGIPARSRVSFDVSYTPQQAGSHTGNIILKDKDGKELRIVVRGVATDPAKLAIAPDTVKAGTLDVADEAKTVSFTVANNGNYPLEYVFPKFSDRTIDGATAKLHQYGYAVSTNIEGYNGGFEYDGNAELSGATDVHSQLNDNMYLTSAIPLGFSFPYYGKSYDRVYITSFGALFFAQPSMILREPLGPASDCLAGTAAISAYGRIVNFGSASKIEYAKQDGKFVVRYKDVLALAQSSGGDNYYVPVTFRIVLSSTGDVEMFYDDYTAERMFQNGSTLFCGITDPELGDALTVTDVNKSQYRPSWDYWSDFGDPTEENQRFTKINSGTAVKFTAPKGSFVQSIDKPYGLVNPGDSVEIKATVKATTDLDAGETYNDLAIVTNDPAPEASAVRITATITGAELRPDVLLESSNIKFGDIFRTAKAVKPVTVKNNGHDKITITSVDVIGEGLSVSAPATPFVIEPHLAKDLNVTVSTEQSGEVSGTVKIGYGEGDNISADITANVIGCPGADLSFTEVEETVASGDPLHKDLVVTNNGDEPLVYAITPNPIASLTLPESNNAEVSYVYSFSDDTDNDVTFAWEDVETNGLGTHTGMSYYNLFDYVAVDLPFEFPFYGKKYNKMYIYNTGFVSFTERHDDNIWPEPPAEFPGGTVYTNIIAPYWGLHSPNQTTTSGTYHYITDDRAVISFMEYGNSMNYDVCYQLIMEKDGTFKFQYKAFSENGIITNPFGLAGLSNEDGSEGVKIPDYMISFGKAVSFAPVAEYTLAPQQQATIGMDFSTARMAGEYSTAIKMATNVPGREQTEIPVRLTITGEAAPVWPADTIVEHTVGYQSKDKGSELVQMGAMYDLTFTVGNSGTDVFTINYIDFQSPTYMDPYFGYEDFAFMLLTYADELDWNTGEPTGKKTWMNYYGDPINVGKEGAKFAIPVFDYSPAFYEPGTYEIPITFYYADGSGNQLSHTTNVTFNITPPPYLTLDKEGISVVADTDDAIATETLTVGNEGEYQLTYSLTLDPSGVGEVIEDEGGAWGDPDVGPLMSKRSPAELAKLSEGIAEGRVGKKKIKPLEDDDIDAFDLPTNFEFNDALYYPHIATNNAAYNYGSTNTYDEYKAAVTFTAPSDGFNISHLYTAVTAEEATDYVVRYDIVQGDDPDGENILGGGKLLIESQDNASTGSFYVVPLDKPVFVNPGETFTVVATYSAGSKYPAYLVAKEEKVVPNRYRGWVENYGWFDIAELFNDTYGSLGYILSCLETEEGQPWVRLLDTPAEDTVAVGEARTIKVEVNAAAARMEKNNKAVLVIKSNDPSQPVINFPITLDCNGKPVIEAASGIIAARENDTTLVTLTVTEPDADNLALSLADRDAYSAIVAVTPAEGDTQAQVSALEDGSYEVSGTAQPVTVTVAITPGYGTASTGHSFTLLADDGKGHSNDRQVRYDIEHVNRAPEATEQPDVLLAPGELSEVIRFADMFTDPDGDELTYAVSLSSTRAVEAFTGEDAVVFSGKRKGSAKATITATDPSGATAELTLKVVVDETNGISGITGADSQPKAIYDLQGRRVLRTQKGVYIVDGEKKAITKQ